VAVPSSEDEHGVLEDYCGVAEPVERLDAFALDFFPFVFLILDAALIHVTKPLLTVVPSIHEETAIPQHHRMVCPLAGTNSALESLDIEPLAALQVVVEEVLVEVPALLLVPTEEEELIVIEYSLGS